MKHVYFNTGEVRVCEDNDHPVGGFDSPLKAGGIVDRSGKFVIVAKAPETPKKRGRLKKND